MPKVSVVIPTRNRAVFLKAAIESVLRQTFQDFEIIVIDDASEDETGEVIKAFNDSRICLIRHNCSQGQGRTRNDGIKHGTGEYIALLDDDDEWLPTKLHRQVYLLDRQPEVGFVYTGFIRVDEFGGFLGKPVIAEVRGRVSDHLCKKNILGTCSTVLLRRRCFDKVGLFDEELSSGADYDMWIRLSREFEVDCIREPLVFYRIHARRISTTNHSLMRGVERLLRKHRDYFAQDRMNYSRRYASLGIHYCCAGDLRKGRQALRQAIRIYPLNFRSYYNLLLSVLGAERFKRLKMARLSPLAVS